MSGTLLFDEPYYARINEARWAAASALLDRLAAAGTTSRTCLDVGSGPGWFAERLVARGLEVVGLEGRADLVAEAARRVPGARFVHADVQSEAVLAAARPADLVFCFGLLYHLESPVRALRHLRALTGRVLLLETQLTPGDAAVFRLVEEGRNQTQGLTYHALIPTLPALAVALRAAGFREVAELTDAVAHEDFEETEERERRRRILVAGDALPGVAGLATLPEARAPKHDYRKAGR